MNDNFLLGALVDPRTDEQRDKDYHINEIVASATPVNWIETKPSDIRRFPVQNQGYKSDCVAETRRKLQRIIFKENHGLDLDFSSVELYRRRSNYPSAGMIADDAARLTREGGMTLNILVPSDEITSEDDANKLKIQEYNKIIAKTFVTSNEVTFTRGDIETIASTIQSTRKGVMVWFYFTSAEWAKEVPTIDDSSMTEFESRSLRHSVTAVEPALYNGVKGLWIEDSAHFGGLNRRFITEEFFKRRNLWASYPINFKFNESTSPVKPKYIIGSVVSLQDCLKYEGVFPINTDSTGFLGPITVKAIKDFQKKYGLEQVGTVGPKTTAKLLSLYP
jgi:hypothetical protein